MWPYCPEMRLTGSSKLATNRRWMPNTSKNSFQKVCFSAASLSVPAQLCANWMARWRISFHESGMREFYPHGGRLSAGICGQGFARPSQAGCRTQYFDNMEEICHARTLLHNPNAQPKCQLTRNGWLCN